MKQLLTIIFTMILSLSSCIKNKEIISEENINKFSKGSYITPSKYGNLNLFVLTDDEEIIITNADYLNYVYDNHYKNKFTTYAEFLSEVLNEKMKIEKSAFQRIPYESFKIHSIVEKEYRQLRFNDFFNKYAKNYRPNEDSHYLNIKENPSLSKIRTISYYFYLNGYQTIRGDDFPRYSVFKRDKLMK